MSDSPPVMRVMMTQPDYAAMAKAILDEREDVEVTDAELLATLVEQAQDRDFSVDWCRRQDQPAEGEAALWHCDLARCMRMIDGQWELRGRPARVTIDQERKVDP